ncbi:MAG: choice-of-anchor R domain-containing protein [bacterium]|nr:choice-of-anchor R domain-containing protein [bacterium]
MEKRNGFASLTIIILVFAVSLFVVALMVLSSLNDERIARKTISSLKSIVTSESGLEDVLYRIKFAKNYSSSETFALNGGTVVTISGGGGNDVSVTSTGDISSYIRRLTARLIKNTSDVEFHYGVQVGDGGLIMENNSKVVGNVYSNGNITGLAGAQITGDAWVAGGTQSTPNQEWTTYNDDFFFGLATGSVVTAVDTAGKTGQHSSLALGSDGFARISYYDYDNSDKDLEFVRCTNVDCTAKNITVVESSGDVGQFSSLALGSDGFARISYYDNSGGNLKFVRCTNADCTAKNITTVDSTGDVGQFSSIVLDAGDLASIAYYSVSDGDLKFARCIDVDCTTNNIRAVDTADDVGTYTALVLGSDNVARISYIDQTLDDLKFARCNDNNCSSPIIAIVDAASEIAWHTSVALGTDGFARISYYDDTSDNLKFARCTNDNCSGSVLTAVDSGGDVGRYSSIKMGGDDFARITSYDGSNGSIKFVRCTDADCSTKAIAVPDTSGDTGLYTSLALGSDGFGRASYNDASGDNLNFVRCANANCTPLQSQVDIAQSFQTSTSAPINKIRLYIRKVGSPQNATVQINTNSGSDPGKNPGDVLASGTLSANLATGAYAWVDVTFATSPVLTAGTTYWLLIDTNQDNSNYWVMGIDTMNGYPYGLGKWSPSWNAGSPVWTDAGGDLNFQIFMGGIETKIDNVDIGGNAHAHRIENSTVTSSAFSTIFIDSSAVGDVFTDVLEDCSSPIGGDAAYNSISNCTVNGVTTTPTTPPADPPPQNMPISQGQIDQWKLDAASGGTYNGDFAPGSSTSLGPKVINGNLILTTNNVVLTIKGTVYVQGYIDISNGSTIQLDAGYGSLSGAVLADEWIHVANNGTFRGSGQSGSYLMLLTTSSCTGVPAGNCTDHDSAIDLLNNADGAIFYASSGLIYLHNGVSATELTSYKLQLSQTATITYQQGLANAQFSSGPGASWVIQKWREVE